MKINEFLSAGFDLKQELNPLLWAENKEIRPEIRQKLLEIALHFKKFVDVEFPIIDVVITGGMTGKYYTEHSDLDLHLVTDYSKISCDQELEELFDTKRKLYKNEYDIRIKGIPVELYVEDRLRPAVGGSFSIIKNRWISDPTEPRGEIDQASIEKNSHKFFELINRILASDDISDLKTVKNLIWTYRQQGLQRHGEFGIENLTFKTLRNSGILSSLLDRIKKLEQQDLGLDQ